jgi:hypothetical protein
MLDVFYGPPAQMRTTFSRIILCNDNFFTPCQGFTRNRKGWGEKKSGETERERGGKRQSVAAKMLWYHVEGIEMRQLTFRSADVYCQNINNPNAHSRSFYTQTERRGNRQAVRETEKERVQVWVRCGKTDDGIRHKN